MATGSPDTLRLTGLVPALGLVVRARWLLCLVGAAQSVAPTLANGILPADLVRFAAAGGLLLRGRWPEVYADPWMQAGPFELLASWLLFPFGHQHTADYVRAGHHGSVGLRLVLGAALVAGVMLLVRHLRSVHDLPRSGPLELAAGLTAVLLAVPYQFWMGGHLAQFGVPLMWVLGASAAVRGRTTAAGLILGLSAGWEPWGVLAAGILLVERRPARLVRGCLALAAGALACYLPFVATGHFAMFNLTWPIRAGTPVSAFFPDRDTFGWPLRLLQGSAAGLAGMLVALTLGRRRDLIWLGPLAVLVVRLLLDPLLLSYYWSPFLIAATIGVGLLHPPGRGVLAGLVVALAAVPLLRFRYLPGQDVPLLLLTAVLIVALVVNVRRVPVSP